jgi:hypothetical protein
MPINSKDIKIKANLKRNEMAKMVSFILYVYFPAIEGQTCKYLLST